MPRYRSRYDTNPLPDPGDSFEEPPAGSELSPSKSLRVNWLTPQPLHTVTAGEKPPGGETNAGGEAENGGGTEGEDEPSLDGHEPKWDAVQVRPEDLLAHEQLVLDEARKLAELFNRLVVDSEAVLGAEFWGTEEGTNQTQRYIPGSSAVQRERTAGYMGPHYVYTSSAQSTRKFLEGLRTSQRGALQHAANAITTTSGFIELLNATADLYATADQYSVFPDRSAIPPA
ncbi:hypothetical protein ACIBTV_24425 [Micromonospora sp. NPDC049366]|uniref:hypothetical protein n=1 Tax=Micromonospora sp. NPDC049366 TaxID=3364271 RepID=UPI003791386C